MPTIPPTPFGPERARAILDDATKKGMFWRENIQESMTPGELAYVESVWDTMPGHTCWYDAFQRIRKGTNP